MTVLLGPERCPILPTSLRLARGDSDEAQWLVDVPYLDSSVKLAIPGGQGPNQGPNPADLELAQLVGAKLDPFLTSARRYLHAFIEPARFDCDEWHLELVQLGLLRARPAGAVTDTALELGLSLDGTGWGDLYGDWRVRYSSRSMREWEPWFFSRAQT